MIVNFIAAHLQQRFSVDNQGALFLSAPANSGVYNLQVVATTVESEATATAQVKKFKERTTIYYV